MTNEQLKRAKEIEDLLPKAKRNLEKWETTKKLYGYIKGTDHDNRDTELNTSFIPFDVIKVLSIEGYKKLISDLENEFASL